jgi:hypothetical protein
MTQAQEAPTSIASLGVEEHIGSKLSLDQFTFSNENGLKVNFSNYFNKGVPILLAVLSNNSDYDALKNELSSAFLKLPFIASKSFDVIFVSSVKLISNMNWTFLTGNPLSITQLKNELGTAKAPTSGIYILRSNGEISRYLYMELAFMKKTSDSP